VAAHSEDSVVLALLATFW